MTVSGSSSTTTIRSGRAVRESPDRPDALLGLSAVMGRGFYVSNMTPVAPWRSAGRRAHVASATRHAAYLSDSVAELPVPPASEHDGKRSASNQGAMMGRIGRTYPRPQSCAEVAIPKDRVLFLSPLRAVCYQLHRAQPLVWLSLLIGLIVACVAAGF